MASLVLNNRAQIYLNSGFSEGHLALALISNHEMIIAFSMKKYVYSVFVLSGILIYLILNLFLFFIKTYDVIQVNFAQYINTCSLEYKTGNIKNP